jgi:hypothetical protein
MNARRRWSASLRGIAVASAAVCVVAGLAVPGGASAPRAAVERPEGAGPPVAATGIGTTAALENPRCNVGPEFGPYGRLNTAFVGGLYGAGPVCVKPFEAGTKNGGASSKGVTADAIRVVFVHPSPAALALAAGSAQGNPSRRADNTVGTYEDGAHDYLLSILPFYETWGRDIEVVNYTSTGNDEASQRADAVEVLAMKPFAVINVDTAGLDVFEAAVAKGKTIVFGYGTSPEEAQVQAPFRWGGTDSQAASLVSAELIGKQLVGKKAEFAGDELKGETRKLGMISVEVFEPANFEKELAKFDGEIAAEATYPGSGAPFGDPAVAGQHAATIVGQMKAAGITTVVLFSDVAMNTALMAQATAQNWFPEWFYAGWPGFVDIPPLARAYDDQQVAHMFGISTYFPYASLTAEQASLLTNAGYDWFWGAGVGTTSPRSTAGTSWLLAGIHSAGPKLTPKTFQQGLFSLPAPKPEGSDSNPILPLAGYGKVPGLPYDGYIAGPLDFSIVWLDPTSNQRLSATSVSENQASWYVNDGTRYGYGTIPKQPFKFFDPSAAILELEVFPEGVAPPTLAPPCPAGACPTTGASAPTQGSPGTEWMAVAWPNGVPPTAAG